MKIRTAVFGVYVAASAIGFAVLMGFVLREVRPWYVESMRRTLSDTAALLAAMLESDLVRPESPGNGTDLGAAWRENHEALERASGAMRVYLTNAERIVVFDSAGGQDVGQDYTRRPEMQGYFRSEDRSATNASVHNGELRVTAPVRSGREIVGFVGVGRPLSSVTSGIWRARVRLAAGGGLIAGLMVVAGWWLANRLSHSIEKLTFYAQSVRDGNAATPPQSRATEVAALTKAFEEMRAAIEGKAYVERYTQTLAHEIKAPLSAIKGAAELLGEDMPAEEQRRFLENIRNESGRIQHIVDQLLRLSGIEARGGRINAERVELCPLVAGVVDALQPAAEARGVRIARPADVSVAIEAERFLIVHSLTNLLQNALEFSPRGGLVFIGVALSPEGVTISVEDQGPGIPDYATGRVFERFYSLPRPDTDRKSTGLGLSFVSEAAALHGGRVTLANRRDGGARAEFSLPVSRIV